MVKVFIYGLYLLGKDHFYFIENKIRIRIIIIIQIGRDWRSMILRKYMSLLGIGSATIDLKLNQTKLQAGDCVTGHFHIQGGTIEQQLKRIECDLVMMNEEENKEETIESTTIFTTQMIESQEENQLQFRFTLPADLEKSSSTIKYRFKTKMIFDAGVKSEDQDLIYII